MRVRERHVPDRWLFGNGDKECTSCGVVLSTRPLEPSDRRQLAASQRFLLVEQMDQENRPWGIPAGRVEDFEIDPKQTAVREVEEETGLVLSAQDITQLFTLESDDGQRVKIIYSALVPTDYMKVLGPWNYVEGLFLFERNYGQEIGRIASVGTDELFSRGHSILTHYYRWNVLHYLKVFLENMRVL